MITDTALRPSELVRESVRLGSPPLIYQRLMEVINHPRGGAIDVANVIRDDTALTARLLKVVNSAFYGFPSRIDTVSQAIAVVGTSQVKDLAMATSVVTLFKDVPQDLVSMDGFWFHSLACGTASRVLAGLRQESNVERFFVSGILHDVGKLVCYLLIPDQSREALQLAREENELLHKAEHRVLGFDHAQVGEALMEQWNMPDSLRESVRFHHDPLRSLRFPAETAAIHTADIFANALGLGSGGEIFVPPLSAEAWELLGADQALLSSAIDEMEHQFEAAVHLVGLEKS